MTVTQHIFCLMDSDEERRPF